MKDRIRQLMEQENLTPSKFADMLQINRAIISHILNGRNNPSLDVIMKIISHRNDINPEWLLTGEGPMYKNGREKNAAVKEPDLFHQNEAYASHDAQQSKERKENTFKSDTIHEQLIENKSIEYKSQPEKKITQIIIYYSDHTFEIFLPEKGKIGQ